MARKIVLTSGKGGVGKSTICLSLGKQLAFGGAKVVMLDVDVGLNNLDIVAGIQPNVLYDVVDVLEHRVRINQALVQDSECLDLFYLPSCHTYNVGRVTPEDLKSVVAELEDFDYILLDCPAGIDFGFHRAVFCAGEALIVTTPHITAVRDADKVATLLCHYDLDSVGLVVNRLDERLIVRHKMLDGVEIANALKLPLLGQIPESKDVNSLASISGKICTTDNKFNNAIASLAENVFFGNYACRELMQKVKRGEKYV